MIDNIVEMQRKDKEDLYRTIGFKSPGFDDAYISYLEKRNSALGSSLFITATGWIVTAILYFLKG